MHLSNANEQETRINTKYRLKKAKISGLFTFVQKKTLPACYGEKDMDLFTGRVELWENGKYIWSKYSKSTRLTYQDAMDDANWMRLELLDGRDGILD